MGIAPAQLKISAIHRRHHGFPVDRTRDEAMGARQGNRTMEQSVPPIRQPRSRFRNGCAAISSFRRWPFELRLTVGAEEARLQWRSEANAGFAELERVQAGNIAGQFEKGTLAIAPNSLPLWSAAYRRFAARVRPFLLRRAKAQVEKDLPDRVEEDLLCEMEGEQKTLYRAELKRARQLILGLKTDSQLNPERFHVLTSLLRLRQICCHPALVDANLREAESAKVSALEDLLEPLLEEGHKVLVFSQFVTMLDLLRENVKQRGWPHFYLAGETENRGELVREFQSAKDGAVFLISLKGGGFGLKLTNASYVVLFDPWWNPAVENQAIDRTHRIGQTSKVMAYRPLMRESVEQKIRALQKQKAALACDLHRDQRVGRSSSQNRKSAAEPCGNGDSTGVVLG
jgi:hypothetical protein